MRWFDEEVKKIVRVPSILQPIRGVLTSGPVKSLKYSLAKLAKSKGGKSSKSSALAIYETDQKLMTSEYPEFTTKHGVRSPIEKTNTKIFLVLVASLFLYAHSRMGGGPIG